MSRTKHIRLSTERCTCFNRKTYTFSAKGIRLSGRFYSKKRNDQYINSLIFLEFRVWKDFSGNITPNEIIVYSPNTFFPDASIAYSFDKRNSFFVYDYLIDVHGLFRYGSGRNNPSKVNTRLNIAVQRSSDECSKSKKV